MIVRMWNSSFGVIALVRLASGASAISGAAR
jgi:hypothetical protein